MVSHPPSHPPIETENKLKGFKKKTFTLSRKEDAVPVFTKKEIATLMQHIEILDWHHKNGMNQRRTAAHFNKCYPNLVLTQPLISKWLKNEEKWRQQWAKANVKQSMFARWSTQMLRR